MSLGPGSVLGPFKIRSLLGKGGMGEVFSATDTRLDRQVALKILPSEFASDADRLRRFQSEAKVLASLNHPNILVIHEVGAENGNPYLVSELLEGRTLREELSSGALPSRKATDYALQIAQGLAAAHTRGIIHRDLKPENIFITEDGRVKILDFGLAKLSQNPQSEFLDPQSSGEAATLLQSTVPGLILGTPAYMSPEQVRGEPADHRSDIFAFGCILREMLTGAGPFRRNTPAESMAAILNDEPSELSASNVDFPPMLERVARRCLEKQPQRRFQSADDLAFALENCRNGSNSPSNSIAAKPRSSSANLKSLFPWAFAAISFAAFIVVLLQGKSIPPRPAYERTVAPVRKFELVLPQPAGKTAGTHELHLAISPDGQKLAYADADGLWWRWLGRLAPPVLLSAGQGILDPFWSPESSDIAFFDGRKLQRISLNGGHPTLIGLAPEDPKSGIAGGAWLPGGKIIFATGMGGLYEVSEEGGKVTSALARADGDLDLHHASPLPGGRGILLVAHRNTAGTDTIALLTSEGQRRVLLHLPGSRLINPVFSSTGHILFQRLDVVSGLWAFAFSLAKLERVGEPFRVSDVGNQASVSADGTLVFSLHELNEFAPRQLAWLDRSGKILGTVGPPLPGLGFPRLSPDGRRIAAASGESASALDLLIFDLADGGALPFTRNDEREDLPFWLDDGRTVLFTRFSASGSQVMTRPADRSAPEKALFQGAASDLSRTGKYLLVTRQSAGGKVSSGYVSMADSPRKIIPLPETLQHFYWMRLSPDDRLLAYHSAESGRPEVYVVDFPNFTHPRIVSRNGGLQPEWHPNSTSKGGELFYFEKDGRTLMSARLNASGESFEGPEKLFDLPESIYYNNPWRMSVLDIAPEGDRFLMLLNMPDQAAANQSSRPNVLVVENWIEEFPAKR
jgi:serine/threonine protein kinase